MLPRRRLFVGRQVPVYVSTPRFLDVRTLSFTHKRLLRLNFCGTPIPGFRTGGNRCLPWAAYRVIHHFHAALTDSQTSGRYSFARRWSGRGSNRQRRIVSILTERWPAQNAPLVISRAARAPPGGETNAIFEAFRRRSSTV